MVSQAVGLLKVSVKPTRKSVSFSISNKLVIGHCVPNAALSIVKFSGSGWRLSDGAAERLSQNLQWRQAATRKAMPTKIAPIPPAVATKLSHSGLPDVGSL
jgi:hypothetical protein